MNRIQSDCHVTRLRQPLKMKFLVVLAIAVACANADVLTGEAAAPIVRSSYDSSPEGNNFNYGFETGNNILTEVNGFVKNPNSEAATLEITGSYSYPSSDGGTVETSYVANENGYQVQGSHIPVSPPIPVAIARALEWIAAHPPAVEPSKKF